MLDCGRDNTISVASICEGQRVMLCAKVRPETPTHEANKHAFAARWLSPADSKSQVLGSYIIVSEIHPVTPPPP